MKRLLLLTLTILISSISIYAQKFCYIDTEYILEHIPEYREAQQKLDNYSIQWQAEIEKKYTEIDKLYKAFQAEHILLTEEMKKKRENEIITKEKEVKKFQKKKFGYQGELFQKRQELTKPVQDRVYDAIQKMAKERSFAIIFDKTSDLVMVYSNPKYDESDRVIRNLGYTPGNIPKDKKQPKAVETKTTKTETEPKSKEVEVKSRKGDKKVPVRRE